MSFGGSEIVLIITSVVFAGLIILASVYFLAYFQHPDDKWVAYFPKIIVISGLSMSAYNIFLLPLDIGLQGGEYYSESWEVVARMCLGFYTASCVVVMVVVPFTMFWYEGLSGKEDEDGNPIGSTPDQLKEAMKYTVPITIVTGGVIAALWYFIGYADVPIFVLRSTLMNWNLTSTRNDNDTSLFEMVPNMTVLYTGDLGSWSPVPPVNTSYRFTDGFREGYGRCFFLLPEITRNNLINDVIRIQTDRNSSETGYNFRNGSFSASTASANSAVVFVPNIRIFINRTVDTSVNSYTCGILWPQGNEIDKSLLGPLTTANLPTNDTYTTISANLVFGTQTAEQWKGLINVFQYTNISVPRSGTARRINPNANICAMTNITCDKYLATATVRVSGLVYAVTMVSLLGWLLFSIFGGIGFISLPVDLVFAFVSRTKPISKETYLERKKILGEQAQILMDAGKTIQSDLKSMPKSNGLNKASRNLRRREKEFRTDVLILEYHYRRLEDSFKAQGGNFILQVLKLIGGCLGAVLTLFWIIHIVLFVYPTAVMDWPNSFNEFLNDFFSSVSPVPFVGTVFYALFTFYLLACTIKGVTKVGIRLPFVSIHPMEIGETMMHSFVFNVGVILASSLAVAQFNSIAFGNYARYSAIQNTIFGVNTKYMRGLGYVFKAFVVALTFFTLVTLFLTVYRPPKKQKENRLNFKW